MFPFKLHLVEFGGCLADGFVEDAVLLLHILDPSLSTHLAALTQRRHRLAEVLVLVLQTLQLDNGQSFNDDIWSVSNTYVYINGIFNDKSPLRSF